MKTKIINLIAALVGLLFLSTNPLQATEANPPSNTTAPSKVSQPMNTSPSTPTTEKTATVDYKDAFLGLLLEKSKLYSGKVENALGAAIDVTTKEAPGLMKEFLLWRAWKHGILFFFPFFILVTTISALVLILRTKWWKELSEYSIEIPGILILSTTITIISLIGVCCNFSELISLIQIWTAPRIYLIEQAMQLVGK